MSGYIGNIPVPQATQTRQSFTATAGQTSFATGGYSAGYIDVYLNGIRLVDGTDYTATNGSDVVLTVGAAADDILEILAFTAFEVANVVRLKNYTTSERNALTGSSSGDTIYNSTRGSIEFYDGANWIATNLIPTINSVTGTIYAGAASTLTIDITNATEEVTVRFSEGGVTIDDVENVTVTSGSASVTVPSAVYGQTAGDTLSVSIVNQNGTPSSNGISKTVQALPSGGTVTTSGGYRYHTFTSSGTFTNTLASLSVDYLVVAGGGGGGSRHGGGGGAGGAIDSTGTLSATTYSIVIGGGGAGAPSGGDNVATQGSSSSGFGSTATGGGFGSSNQDTVGSGGSGGGSRGNSSSAVGGSGTSGQGNRGGGDTGGNGGGGGGGKTAVGADGTNAKGGNGGAGINWKSLGTYYAGGGGGGVTSDGVDTTGRGTGGSGGGGNGNFSGNDSTSGAANTGGGGGGGGHTGSTNHQGKSGGSGIVIVRYQVT